MTLYLPNHKPVRLRDAVEIGSGAAGIVYGLPSNDAVCLKLYLTPSAELGRRFDGLRRLRPASWAPALADEPDVAWPVWDLRDGSGDLRGIVVPRAAGVCAHALFDPTERRAALDRPTWAVNLVVATQLAAVFERLHAGGVVVGDVSPANVIVDRSARVTLIDCDSVQFTDPQTGERFPALNVTPEYASPESLHRGGRWLSAGHDLFGLAILICQLLLEGEHPYEGVPAGRPDAGVEGNILAGAQPVLRSDRLPAELHDLAIRSLVDGWARPDRRTVAARWRRALQRVAATLVECRRDSSHVYPRELGCPQCVTRAVA